MPKWIKHRGRQELVLTQEDIDKADPLLDVAAQLWLRDGKDEGSVCIGAGIAVRWIPPRCRNPVDVIVIPSPFQGDGGNSVNTPINYLCRHGIAAFFEPGRMD